jgi:glyoxylase-like metal-dependent hydrolase (beta-lactamase superfamily II)
MDGTWNEVADRVFVRRHRHMDVNVGLVVGDGQCLVVDTRCSDAEGQELAAAVREVTPAPWSVAVTHAHFDHCFGMSALVPARMWAQERCATAIEGGGATTRARIAALYDEDGQPGAARQIRDTALVIPDGLVGEEQVLSVGGRRVELRHFGRGHTDHDLVVVVPDADVVMVGDLVEDDSPPQFRDAFPLEWVTTLDALLGRTSATVVVPGHGGVVSRGRVAAQRDELAELVQVSREGLQEGLDTRDVAARLPHLGASAEQAVERTCWQLRHGWQ